MIALDSSPDPPLEQVHLSYKAWVQATPLPRERLRTNYMRMRYATFQHHLHFHCSDDYIQISPHEPSLWRSQTRGPHL